MRTVHVLTDVYGPRLTGSPNHKAAAEWAIKQMTEWGFENAHLEPWDFGHPGWANERASGFIVSPVKDSLVLEVLAWTPSTKGTVTAKAFQIAPPQCPSPAGRGEAAARAEGAARPDGPKCPTQEELTKYFDGVRADVKGKIVLVGRHTAVPVSFNPAVAAARRRVGAGAVGEPGAGVSAAAFVRRRRRPPMPRSGASDVRSDRRSSSTRSC